MSEKMKTGVHFGMSEKMKTGVHFGMGEKMKTNVHNISGHPSHQSSVLLTAFFDALVGLE
jgi:hypothetical protein